MFFRKENLRRFAEVTPKTWMEAIPQDVDSKEWRALWADIKKPQRATEFSAGYDFYAPFGFTLEPGEVVLVPTGIKAYMNSNNELKFYPRSSLGFKYQMRIANTVPKIDADYVDNPKNEGHIFIKIVNGGNQTMTIEKGEAFCQGSFYEYLVACDDEAKGKRVGGIGSTSKK